MSKLEHPPSPGANEADSVEQAAQEDLVHDELDLTSGTARDLGAVACETPPCQLCEHYREQSPRTDEVPTSEHTEARKSTTTITDEMRRLKQARTQVQEAYALLGKLNTYVIPGMRNRDLDYNPKNATWVDVPPIIPIVKDPNSPFKDRPFTQI